MADLMKTAPGEPYRCGSCGGEYVAVRTHEECVAEQEIIFGEEHDPARDVVICHDCWVLLMRSMGHNVPEGPK